MRGLRPMRSARWPHGDLPDAPQDGVDAFDEADGGEAEAVVGEQQGEDAPGEAVVEVVDESGLAGAAQ